MDLGLKDRVAIVMAASKGLGRACAQALAAERCRIAICSRNREQIDRTAKEIVQVTGAEVFAAVADVGKASDIESFVNDVARRWGRIDILINNAGGPPVKSFEETNDDEWHEYFDITFMSVVRAVRAVLPAMKKGGYGRIINITSVSVKEPIDNLVYSNALRLGVVGLAKSLANELGPCGITVHNVAPGFYLTDGLERVVNKRMEKGEHRELIFKQWAQSIPLRKIGDPSELAALVSFLASGKSSYMTGTTIQVDGGRISTVM
jgi:3-oxoacyl-[acyl-carrier protein] reductase